MWNKVQRIYLGDKLVRPKTIEESRDFKTTTIADLTAAWWVNGAMSNWVLAQSSSMWLYSSRDGHVWVWKEIDLSFAKKFTRTLVYYNYYASWVWGVSGGTDSLSNGRSDSWESASWNSSFSRYKAFNNNSSYKQTSISAWSRLLQEIQYWLPTWEHTFVITADFETWEAKFECAWQFSVWGTLTSEEIQRIKSNSKRLKASICYNGNRQHQLWNMSRKVE